MKHILITTSILFAFSGAFAQVKGTKNIKPAKETSTVRPMSSDVESSSKSKNVMSIKGQSSSSATSKTSVIRPQKAAAGNSTRSSASRVNNDKNVKYSPSALKGESSSVKKPVSKPNNDKIDVEDIDEKSSSNSNRLRSSRAMNSSSSGKSSNVAPAALLGEPTSTKKPNSVKGEGSKGDEESEIINGRRSSSTSISNQSAKGSEKNTPTALKGEPTSTKKPVSKPNKGKSDEEDEEENKEKGER
jgi:hypothetical protein